MTPTKAPTLDELLDRLEAAIALAFEGEGEAWSDALSGDRLAASARRAIEPVLEHGVVLRPQAPIRQFTPAHLRIVFLLGESQGSTHTRLRRAWDAKSARAGALAWPWISDSGLRTRTAELKSWGLVEWSGAYGETPAGRRSRIWQLTGVDPRRVGRNAEPVPGFDQVLINSAIDALRDEAGSDLTIRTQLELAAQVAGAL